MSRDKNFGILRLLFAFLVVASHSSELLYGNRSHEPLTQTFGTLSSGELAVDGFFIVSGFLVTQSLIRSGSTGVYLWKRCRRIYPAFIFAFTLSFLIVGMLAGGEPFQQPTTIWLSNGVHMLTLTDPQLPGVFHGLSYPVLNGSMWTVIYEFRCYIGLVVLYWMGLLRGRRAVLLWMLAVLLLFLVVNRSPAVPDSWQTFVGAPSVDIRLWAMFLTGACYFVFRDKIRFVPYWAALSLGAMAAGLAFTRSAQVAVAIFGSYALFSFAFSQGVSKIAPIGRKTDISYGVYLSAWPVTSCLIFLCQNLSALDIFMLTCPCVVLFGYISWTLIERPCLNIRVPGWRAGVSIRDRMNVPPRANNVALLVKKTSG